MTITDEILIAANKLANAGKKPTVALIKAKLSKAAPLPMLISTLKGWQHQPEFIEMPNTQNNSDSQSIEKIKSDLRDNDIVKDLIEETLAVELKQIKKELCDIKLLIEELSKQLNTNSKG